MFNAFSSVRRYLGTLGFYFGALLAVSTVQAGQVADELDVQVVGFGSVGMVSSDGKSLGFRRDASRHRAVTDGELRFDSDTVLGLQVNAGYNNTLGLVVQGMAKPLDGELDAHIHLVFARFNMNRDMMLRLGRLPHDAYLLSESRDVGVSYLWARPVVEFYGLLLLEHFDGVDFLYRQSLQNGLLEWRAGVGRYDTTTAEADGVEVYTDFDLMWNVNLQYLGNDWRWRLGFLQEDIGEFSVNGLARAFQGAASAIEYIPPELFQSAIGVDQVGLTVRQYSAGLVYDDGIWIAQSEIAKLEYERTFYTGYVSVGRQFERFTPYAVVARIYGRSRDVPASIESIDDEVLKVAGPLLNTLRSSADQTALSLGLRWDAGESVDLKVQWDRRFTKPRHTYMWMQMQGALPERRVDTLSLVVDFSF